MALESCLERSAPASLGVQECWNGASRSGLSLDRSVGFEVTIRLVTFLHCRGARTHVAARNDSSNSDPVLSFLSIASTLEHNNCESFGELHFSALLQGCEETALELPALAIRKPASHVLINQVAFDGLDGLHELLISEGELLYLNLLLFR